MKTFLEKTENPIYEKPLKKGHSLAILEKEEKDVIQVRNAQGVALFTIEVSNEGTNLNIEAENINIKASKKLQLSAENIDIKSKKELFLKSEGNFNQFVKGNKTIKTQGENIETAKTQYIKAYLGDVKLKANDDIKLNGERVKLNCD
ncbi:hypothetical protein Q4512_10365 [Oceanihabitans sp. 2_MG-2023]|uniref:hypothetical protein n=1 Tax=Oceanihabitans sp. 2_MG-2023 TaxID=3062661 RepID=UPI0026E1C78F|nr:hypothetical protein [Oceanihabitans sp. 2_MG-2023]MDO6597316.1 hypothetical protein [Oceanihabitans sp. 2_MG-2023]